MSTYELGFIGTGNMGGALAQAAAKSGASMLLSNRTAAKAEALAAELGCAAGTNQDISASCRFIFLGVKPQMLPALLTELKAPLSTREDRVVLVSMAAGVTIRTIKETLGLPCPVVRIMPNLPVALGKGVVLISPDDTVTEDELTELEGTMEGVNNYCIAVKEKGDDIVFLRKIVKGGADKSYGIQVAKLAGVPESVISRAKELVEELSQADISVKAKAIAEESQAKAKQKTKPKTYDEVDLEQISLFDTVKDDDVVKELQELDISNMTPMDAMNTLYRLQNKLKNRW